VTVEETSQVALMEERHGADQYLNPARDTLKALEALLARTSASTDPQEAAREYQEALVQLHRVQVLLELASHAGQYGETVSELTFMGDPPLQEFKLRLVTRTGHTAPLRTFTFSPDGLQFATAGADKRLVLWDTETGMELLSHSVPDVAHTLVLGVQGRFLAAYDEQGRAIRPDVPSEVMPGHCGDMGRVLAFSRDPAKTLMAGDAQPTLGKVELIRGEMMNCLAPHQVRGAVGKGERPIALAPSGQELLVSTADGRVRLQRGTGAALWTFGTKGAVGSAKSVKSAAFATEVRRLAMLLEDGTLQLLDAGSGKAVAAVSGGDKPQGVTLSPSGRYVATYGTGGLRLWRVPTQGGTLQEERLDLPGVDASKVRQAAFAPMEGRNRLAVLQEDGVLHLMELESNRLVTMLRPVEQVPREFRLASAGQYLRVELSGGAALWWDVREGAVRDAPADAVAELAGPAATIRWEADSLTAWGNWMTAVLRDPNGVAVGYGQFGPHSNPTRVFLAPSLDRVAVLDTAGRLSIRALKPSEDGLLLKTQPGDTPLLSIQDVSTAIFSPSGQHLYVGRTNGLIQLWDLSTQTRLAHLVAWPDGSWAVADSDGRFDAANGGDIDGLYWVLGLEPIALSQLKARYYEPFLLPKLLGLQDERPREVQGFTAPKLYPLVQAQLIEQGTAAPRLRVTLKARSGGFGRALVSLNGKEILQLSPARIQSLLPEGAKKVSCTWKQLEASCDIPLVPFEPFIQRRASRPLAGQKAAPPVNLLSVQAYNAEEYLVSRPVTLEYIPTRTTASRGAESVDVTPSASELVVPRLWAVVAGVSDYTGSAIDLRFASKDADDFARALDLTARRLLCARADGSLDKDCDRVRIRRLSTTPGLQNQCLPRAPGAKPGAEPFTEPGETGGSCKLKSSEDPCQPDKSNLLRALEELEKAAPEDIVVVYLAGHGATFKGRDQEVYNYLTTDAWSLDMTDPELRCRGTLSSTTLSEALRRVPARKQVMILDTCHSGAMVMKLTGSRGMSASQVRAMEQMKDQSGMYVLAGAPSDAVSYESPEFAQGLLTYSLLKGLADKDALAQEALVDVGRLFDAASKRVSEVAKGMNRQQRPVIAMPRGGGNFYIGQLKDTEQQAIQSHLVLEPRPRFVLPAFFDSTTWRSEPKLREAVTSELRERGYRDNPALAFVEVQDLPGAYELVGTLDTPASRGTASKVTARIFLAGKQVGCTFQVPVSTSAKPTTTSRGTTTASPGLTDDVLRSLATGLVEGALKQLSTRGTSSGACTLK
jgi:WD40 repeat protein